MRILMAKNAPWIGVDLDGTLAYYVSGQGIDTIGAPIPAMVNRVKKWLDEGKTVKIMTARFSQKGQVKMIHAWSEEVLGRILEVTDRKDYNMIELWDDRAVRVKPNQGFPCCYYDRET